MIRPKRVDPFKLRGIANMSKQDQERLIQCIFCAEDPRTCGCDEKDEDEHGMCKKSEEEEQMAKCTVEPKLDFDKFKEACERFKKICERELGDACAYIDDEVYPVILKEMEVATKNDELIILRPTTFMKAEDFEMAKEVWEREIPNSVVIPYSMDVINRNREWIPTSLCLPQRDRPVLVAVKTKARLPKWVEKPTYYYVTDIDVYADNVYDGNGWMDNGKNVAAWQPLPAPYKGE